MSDQTKRCQFSYRDFHDFSSPILFLTPRRFLYSLKMQIQERKSLLVFAKIKIHSLLMRGKTVRRTVRRSRDIGLNLKPGDLVEVLSEEEILPTLDTKGKLRGLDFMPEMKKYCGHRFRVYKRLEKITLETTGEMRNIRNTVLLRGVICDGSAHFGCDRSCFCFWREAWLKKIIEEK